MRHLTVMGRQRGSAMMEALIAFVILMVGLLGLVGLQANVQVANTEAYQRAQALVLMGDMAEKLTIYRNAAMDPSCLAITTDSRVSSASDYFVGASGTGELSSISGRCSATGDPVADAAADAALSDWSSALKGASETAGGNSIGGILGARGCVSFEPTTRVAVVSVAWQGMSDTYPPVSTLPGSGAPSPALLCGQNLYGGESKRRLVFTTIHIPNMR